MDQTREKQYQICLDLRDGLGLASLGLMTNQVWHEDPKRLTFVLSRYKFVAKMLAGRRSVFEVGCADAFASRIVRQEVESLTVADFDPVFIEDCRSRMTDRWPFECRVHDMCEAPLEGDFDGAYSLDVLEHIQPDDEDRFIGNICRSLVPRGVLLIGTPSLESQQYASPPSKEGHVNCKTGPRLKQLMERYFHSVFLFSMNDEVVHTGFYPMAHYLFALCCHLKSESAISDRGD